MKISDADPYESLYGSGSDFYFTNPDPQIRSGSSPHYGFYERWSAEIPVPYIWYSARIHEISSSPSGKDTFLVIRNGKF